MLASRTSSLSLKGPGHGAVSPDRLLSLIRVFQYSLFMFVLFLSSRGSGSGAAYFLERILRWAVQVVELSLVILARYSAIWCTVVSGLDKMV